MKVGVACGGPRGNARSIYLLRWHQRQLWLRGVDGFDLRFAELEAIGGEAAWVVCGLGLLAASENSLRTLRFK